MINSDHRATPTEKQLGFYLKAINKIHTNGKDFGDNADFTIQRIHGGSNNALYKINSPSGAFACKLCVEDIRKRAFREFSALKIIRAYGLDLAPQPILLDESKVVLPYPYVIYRWVNGITLQLPWDQKKLKSFLKGFQQLHNIKPNQNLNFDNSPILNIPTAWFHWFDYKTYLSEIRELFSLYTPWLTVEQPHGIELAKQLAALIDALSEVIIDSKSDPSQQSIPLRLVRVDPNTTNAIWEPDGVMRWIDWEYCGWGDPALDIAEIRWHASLSLSEDDSLQWLRVNYKPLSGDTEFYERLRVWDHILAVRWPLLILRVLWSNYNGSDRKRLSRVKTSPNQLYQRLSSTIQMAEIFFSGDEWLVSS